MMWKFLEGSACQSNLPSHLLAGDFSLLNVLQVVKRCMVDFGQRLIWGCGNETLKFYVFMSVWELRHTCVCMCVKVWLWCQVSYWLPFLSTFLKYCLFLNIEMTDVARLADQWASEIFPSLSPQPRNHKCKPLCPDFFFFYIGAGDTSSSGQAFVEAHYQSIPLHKTQTWYFRFWFYFLLHLNGDC